MLLKKKQMRNLMLLTTLLMMSWNATSQNVTDSTKIQLTKPIAKLVVKDLISGDGLKLEVKTLNQLLLETNNKLETQSILVTNLESQVFNYQTIIDQKDLQLGTSSELTEELNKQLKKEARAKKLYKIGSTVGAAAVLLLLIQ
jgi:hypothetical protein